MARSRGAVTAWVVAAAWLPSRVSANREALSILMARRRPTFIWPSSTAVSTPGRPLAAQYRTPSAPWLSSSGNGVTTLPRDFDIFLRSGSRTHPEIAASVHGRHPYSSSWRTIVLKSQVRMISCAWGRRSMGNTREKRSGSSSRRPAIWGVSDEVAQVSMTSGSPTNPPGTPRWSWPYPSGTSLEGSIGRRSAAASRGWSWSIEPSSPTGYQTGKGTPKNRCRLMFQSPFRPSTHAS